MKSTGEAKIFKEIWETREHFCENCGIGLQEPPRSFYFAHKIRKGKDNSQRLKPENIMLHCLDCHRELDQGTMENYNKRKSVIQ